MFAIDSLASGYLSARLQNKTDDENVLGNMLIMEIIKDPKEVMRLEDTRDIGIALFTISQNSQSAESENLKKL